MFDFPIYKKLKLEICTFWSFLIFIQQIKIIFNILIIENDFFYFLLKKNSKKSMTFKLWEWQGGLQL